MKRRNNINTTMTVAAVIVAVVGCAVSAQAATIGYWRFEGDSGSAVADGTSVPTSGTPILDEISGSNLVGTVSGGVLWQGDDAGDLFGAAVPNPDPLDTSVNGTLNANGVNTRSLQFDAATSDAHVLIADTDVLDISGAFTVEGYFRVDSPAANHQLIFLNKRQINGPNGARGYKAWMDLFGRVHFMADNGPLNGRVGWDENNPNLETGLDDGLWHHFAGVRDDSNDLHIYIDGVEDTTPATNGITNVSGDLSNDEPFRFGDDGFAGGLLGYLDEIRVSDVVLTPDQFLNAVPDEDADFDSDGNVDGGDFVIWQRGAGGAGGLAEGDANSDGVVDGADLGIWENQYGTVAVGAAASMVPEPGAMALAAAGLACLVMRRRSL